jgi:hypothetical protein
LAGQVAAALSGMRDTVVTNTFEKVIEKMQHTGLVQSKHHHNVVKNLLVLIKI